MNKETGHKNFGSEHDGISFESAARDAERSGDNEMSRIHDADGEDPKFFHTSEHPEALKKIGERIADVFGLSAEGRALVRIAFAHHDEIIKYELPDSENIVGMIRRSRGAKKGDKPAGDLGNEALSAKEAEREMRSINERAGKEIFSEEQISAVEEGIHVTYPDVDFGPDGKGATFKGYKFYQDIIEQNPEITEIIDFLESQGIKAGVNFYQPHLEGPLERGEKVPYEVLIVGLADLGAAGVFNGSDFFAEGDKEFWELHANIRKQEHLEKLISGDGEKEIQNREKVVEEAKKWIHSQVSFAAWQMLRFEKTVYLLKKNGQLNEAEERKLREIFRNYRSNVVATLARENEINEEYESAKEAGGEKPAFKKLLDEIGAKMVLSRKSR